MNTTETNKKLAEFLGWKEQTDLTERWFGSFKTEEGILHRNTNKEPMLFHSDWNWLMLVVEKIESFIFENDEYYNFHILGGCCVYIISSHGNELVTSDKGQSKLECVYNACSMFVDWYNKNVSRGTI